MSPQETTVDTAEDIVRALGPADPLGSALVLVGGADSMSEGDRADLEALFGRLVAYLERTGTSVVDGGTDSGVMRLIGVMRDQCEASFRLVGVLPRGALDRTTRDGAPIRVAPGHPEILLTPGSAFGDETELLFAAADHLGRGTAATMVVNGGKLTLEEAHARLAANQRVVVVAGSGRAADELAADEDLRSSGRLHVIPMTATAAELAAALEGDGPG